MAYGLGMPSRKLPTPEDAAAARRIVLDGLVRDADLSELVTELAPLHPRNNTFPARSSCTWPPTRWTGAGRAAGSR